LELDWEEFPLEAAPEVLASPEFISWNVGAIRVWTPLLDSRSKWPEAFARSGP